MAFAKFTTASVTAACRGARKEIAGGRLRGGETQEQAAERDRRIERLFSFALAAHDLSGEVYLTGADLTDIQEGWSGRGGGPG